MGTPLTREFARMAQTDRGQLLATLMLLCRLRCQHLSVVCVGAGDAFITRYWPFLVHLLTQGFLHLVIADRGPLEELAERKVALAQKAGDAHAAEQLRSRYLEVTRMIQTRQPVRYLDLLREDDRSLYDFLVRVNVVFILVPDDLHVQEARQWLGRADLVVVEKPYNRDLAEAQGFEDELRTMVEAGNLDAPHTVVVCIDHYLAKIYPYIAIRNLQNGFHERKVGRIYRIEFRLCEAGPVEPWRAPSLAAGIVYDLFSHVLAMISPFIKLGSFPLGGGAQILVARHRDCPIEAESYAWIGVDGRDFRDGKVWIEGALGKGVWKQQGSEIVERDDKFLRLIGEHGTIYANLDPASAGKVFHESNGERYELADVGKGHKEMLDSIFSGKFMESPTGGLAGKTAVQILKILTSIRTRIERRQADMQREERLYCERDTIEMINAKATRL